jgi:hypothetical protein
VIGSLLLIEFSGGILSYHIFHWLSLHIGVGVCFLVSCLACNFLLVVGSVCEAVIHSLHFIFIISKIQKHLLILHYSIFSFDYFALILTHVERLNFIDIVEITLENLHLEVMQEHCKQAQVEDNWICTDVHFEDVLKFKR